MQITSVSYFHMPYCIIEPSIDIPTSHHSKLMPTPTRAPMPAILALFGLVSFHTSHRIKPTSGMKNPSTAHPKLPLSLLCCEYPDEYAGCW